MIQSFCRALNALHFNEIDTLGNEDIPHHGPLIICSNHANQFVDGSILLANLKRQPHFIGAAKSFRRPIIGHLMRWCQTIPVERAQDLRREGTGLLIHLDPETRILSGQDTVFSRMKSGDTLTFQSGQEVLVEEVLDETHLKIKNTEVSALEQPCRFRVTPKLDYSQMYEAVWSTLRQNKSICIFPEGGSHDRTDLLPLKAGVCMMALGAMAKYGLNVKIVAIGLNYYRADHLQSKAFMIAGKAFDVSQELLSLYKTNKREAIQQLLSQIEHQMREVTVISPDYDHQKALYSIRRIYTTDMIDVSAQQKIQLNQRFSKAFSLMGDHPEVQSLVTHAIAYNKQLSRFNILDKNLLDCHSHSLFSDVLWCVYYFIVALLVLVMLLPGEILVGPMQLALAYLAERERAKALKASSVKLQGRDVVASKKILLSIVFIPLFPFLYSALVMLVGTSLGMPRNTLIQMVVSLICSWPVILYLTYKLQYVLVALLRRIKSRLYFIFSRKTFPQVLEMRKSLKKETMALVDKHFSTVFSEEQRVVRPAQITRRSSIHIEKAFEVLNEIYHDDY